MKHALLILAHNEYGILEKLIKLLDHPNNDIFIHIDKKAQNFEFERFKEIAKYSSIIYTERINVHWGDISIVKATYILLKAAKGANQYDYYHLISGVDLPIKNQKYFQSFFEENNGKEFVHFGYDVLPDEMKDRYRLIWFTKNYKTNSHFVKIINRAANKMVHGFQRIFRVYRKATGFEYMQGSAWFSITDKLADYIIKNEMWVYKKMKLSILPDEAFIQCIVYKSHFVNNLYIQGGNENHMACVRFIDWKRGRPYVFKKEDYEQLIGSEYIFARKFSSNIDSNIIDMIYENLLE